MSEPIEAGAGAPPNDTEAPASTPAPIGPPTRKPAILEGRELTKAYQVGERKIEVLRGVSLTIHPSEILAIRGPSGVGKSTLLHILGLLDLPTSGTVLYDGIPVSDLSEGEQSIIRNQRIGFVFQFYHLLKDLTATENVLLPAMVHHGPLDYFRRRKDLRDRARSLLSRVGLDHRLDFKPNSLSGGEQQRVAIARALMNEPALLLCDEPTGNLDQRTGATILDLLWQLKDEIQTAYVIVTHDRELALRTDRQVEMIDGLLVDD